MKTIRIINKKVDINICKTLKTTCGSFLKAVLTSFHNLQRSKKKNKNKPNQALYRDTCTSNNLHCVPTAPGSLAVLLKSQNTSHCFICISILYSFVTEYIFCIHCFCEGFIRLCIFKMQVQNRYPICPCHSCENGNSPMY